MLDAVLEGATPRGGGEPLATREFPRLRLLLLLLLLLLLILIAVRSAMILYT
jgi:hypothetical protein